MTGGDELAVLHDRRAHVRVRRRPAAPRVDKREVHPAIVFFLACGLRCFGFWRYLAGHG
jgi:hypothetical protein